MFLVGIELMNTLSQEDICEERNLHRVFNQCFGIQIDDSIFRVIVKCMLEMKNNEFKLLNFVLLILYLSKRMASSIVSLLCRYLINEYIVAGGYM